MGAFDQQLDQSNHDKAQPQPLPLMAERSSQADFPVEAMGPILGGAVKATVDYAYVPASIAAQSVLSACSLALQGHFDVRLPVGQVRPISLFIVTVADSGDRKSTSDDYVTRPIREFERELEDQNVNQKAEAALAQSAWDEAKKAATQANKSRGREAIEQAYRDLGPRPEGPAEPTIIIRTGSTQGLVKRFIATRPSLGLMSDEGGSWLGGYGMTEDNRLATISTLSDFWDGKTVQALTSGEGYTALRGRRLTFHMMVQPIVAAKLLGDAEAQGQGFLSRLLVAHPDSLAGKRFIDPNRRPDADLTDAMQVYHERMCAIVRADLPVVEGTLILQPRVLELNDEARLLWYGFYNDIEKRLGPEGDLQCIKGFVGKLPEQAARLAANMAVFELGIRVQHVDAFTMQRGIQLAEFYMGEALRLFSQASPSQQLQDAQMLSDWLRDVWKENFISVQAISQRAPNRIRRGGDYIRSLIDVLVRHEHLSELLPDSREVAGKRCRSVWRVQVRNV